MFRGLIAEGLSLSTILLQTQIISVKYTNALPTSVNMKLEQGLLYRFDVVCFYTVSYFTTIRIVWNL